MINVILNGINLGQTFRGQFDAEVKRNKGDVIKTINEWGKR
jgi:phospholipid transport system substrate-binding protein